jgi:hypothetical protein
VQFTESKLLRDIFQKKMDLMNLPAASEFDGFGFTAVDLQMNGLEKFVWRISLTNDMKIEPKTKPFFRRYETLILDLALIPKNEVSLLNEYLSSCEQLTCLTICSSDSAPIISAIVKIRCPLRLQTILFFRVSFIGTTGLSFEDNCRVKHISFTSCRFQSHSFIEMINSLAASTSSNPILELIETDIQDGDDEHGCTLSLRRTKRHSISSYYTKNEIVHPASELFRVLERLKCVEEIRISSLRSFTKPLPALEYLKKLVLEDCQSWHSFSSFSKLNELHLEFTKSFRYDVQLALHSILLDLHGLKSLKMLSICSKWFYFNSLAQLHNNDFIEQLSVKILEKLDHYYINEAIAELNLLAENMRNLKNLRYMANTVFLEKDVETINNTGRLRKTDFEFFFENIH